MIVTVTLNAAWDRTYFVETFEPGRTHVVSEVRGCPGGKGVNVARAFKALGGRALATGLAGGPTGQAITAGLAAEGIECDFFTIAGESRSTLAVVDRRSGTVTELRERGPSVTAAELGAFERHLRRLLAEATAGFCVISGSLPPGAPPETAARLVRLAREAGARTVLDTSGPALAAGAAAGPTLIKPNYEEALALQTAAGSDSADIATPEAARARRARRAGRTESETRLARAARLIGSLTGPEMVVISLGEEGALLSWEGRLWHAAVSLDRVVNAVGSGDAMVAGLALGLERGEDPPGALRLGVAAGAANALTDTAGRVRPDDFADLLGRVKVTELPFRRAPSPFAVGEGHG